MELISTAYQAGLKAFICNQNKTSFYCISINHADFGIAKSSSDICPSGTSFFTSGSGFFSGSSFWYFLFRSLFALCFSHACFANVRLRNKFFLFFLVFLSVRVAEIFFCPLVTHIIWNITAIGSIRSSGLIPLSFISC